MERVTYVGTHTSPSRLQGRLLDHFVRDNHDGSILRKNVGKAILNACHDPYLAVWAIDTSKSQNRGLMNKEKNAVIEQQVTTYLQENFSFTIFPVDDKDERIRIKEAIIATLNAAPTFVPGTEWLGLHSPESQIRASGLWLKHGLNGVPITETELDRLFELQSF